METLLDMDTLKKYTPEQQKQIIAGIRQQAAIANATSLISALSDKCTTKCITNPGASLTGAERQCVQRCMERFVESWNIISLTFQRRLEQDTAKLQGGLMATSAPSDSSSSSFNLFGGGGASGEGGSNSGGGGFSFS